MKTAAPANPIGREKAKIIKLKKIISRSIIQQYFFYLLHLDLFTHSQSKNNGPKEVIPTAMKNSIIGIKKNISRKHGIPRIQL